MGTYLTERTYLNADRSAVVDGSSPQAYHLLGIAGDEVAADEAAALKLKTVDEWPPKEEKAKKAPPEDKSVKGPAETKG